MGGGCHADTSLMVAVELAGGYPKGGCCSGRTARLVLPFRTDAGAKLDGQHSERQRGQHRHAGVQRSGRRCRFRRHRFIDPVALLVVDALSRRGTC